jgi:hypothetical protein
MAFSFKEAHAAGKHRKLPRKKCPECQALRVAQWKAPAGLKPAPRVNVALEAQRAPQR